MAELARELPRRAERAASGSPARPLRTPPSVTPSPARTGAAPRSAAAPSQRIASVDALRGFSIFWILGGDGLAWSLNDMTSHMPEPMRSIGGFFNYQLNHAAWDGFRFYDFVFPLFIFTAGVAIVLSLPRLVEREGKAKAHIRVLRRFVLLFVLGLLYYGGASNYWPDVRLLGVLQRIALCYLFASLLFLNFRTRDLVVAFVALLVGYWALMTFLPVPGVGAGSFAPGANLANWIDWHYLPGKLFDKTRDPEGLLSTLPAIGTCLVGVFAGLLLVNKSIAPARKSLWLIGGGAAMLAAGYLWSLQFPLIKQIWTSSFVLVCGGYSLLLLGVVHQITDVWGKKDWTTIFMWLGANAILLYAINNVASFERLATRLVGGDIGRAFDWLLVPGTGRLISHALGLAIAIALARFLYNRKIFLRV